MKSFRYLFIAVIGISMVSCQKSYNPPDLVIGGGNTGGSTSGGPLLTKIDSKVTGSNEATLVSLEYDASNRLTRVLTKATDAAGVSVIYYYRYARDAAGRITKIVTNILAATSPGVGFPDSVSMNIHYAANGSFDNCSYSVNLGGVAFRDSSAYVYNASGNITDAYGYQAVGAAPMAQASRIQYIYSGGNVVATKLFGPSSPTVPVTTFTTEFDSKPAAINLGNEAFLPGLDQGYACANNITKNTMVSGTDTDTLKYTYQYNNTTNRPLSAIIDETAEKMTYVVTYTYR